MKPDEIGWRRSSPFEGSWISRSTRTPTRRLQRIIDAKIAGEEVVATAEETPPKVVNLMDALRQSLDRVSSGKKKPVKVETSAPEKAKAAAPAKKRARG